MHTWNINRRGKYHPNWDPNGCFAPTVKKNNQSLYLNNCICSSFCPKLISKNLAQWERKIDNKLLLRGINTGCQHIFTSLILIILAAPRCLGSERVFIHSWTIFCSCGILCINSIYFSKWTNSSGKFGMSFVFFIKRYRPLLFLTKTSGLNTQTSSP